MSAADSQSIFAEGTFEDQVKELVGYLAQGRSDEEKAALIQQFEEALLVKEGEKPLEEDADHRRHIVKLVLEQINGLGEGSEKETEGFFNLFFAHFLNLFSLDAPETREQLLKLVQIITQSNAPSSTLYRILSNLFNSLPRRSGLRLPVNEALIRTAAAHDELEQLALSLPEIEKWLSEWEISEEDKSTYLKTLVDTFAYDPVLSYQYQLAYVRSVPSSQEAAVQLVATALRLPTVFDFDALFRLNAVVAAKDSDIYPLLQIFLNDGIAEYKAWATGNAGVLAKYNLDQAQLERKVRLLSLTTLAFQNIGRDLPYSIIADVLQVDASEVERWVIDVLRAQLVSGKLSQTSQTFHIVRASARAFEREQWEALEKRLVAWKAGLAGVRDVVAAAQKKTNADAPAPAPATTTNTTTTTTNGVEAAPAQPQTTAA